MRWLAGHLTRVGVTLSALALVGLAVLPGLMERYSVFAIAGGPRVLCRAGTACGRTLEATYNEPLATVILEASVRSLALIAGAAVLASTVGLLFGAAVALARHRAVASGAMLGAIGLFASMPSFFAAYFLQILVIFLGGVLGRSVLPVFGFGFDSHLVLPLLAVAVPAVATTAQLASSRFGEVLDSDYVRTAHAKGLWPSWILRVHVTPHVLPLALEAVGSGLRLTVASLPIVEYLFVWNGLGFVAIQAVAGRDAAGVTASGLVLATLFAATGLMLDARRARPA